MKHIWVDYDRGSNETGDGSPERPYLTRTYAVSQCDAPQQVDMTFYMPTAVVHSPRVGPQIYKLK